MTRAAAMLGNRGGPGGQEGRAASLPPLRLHSCVM